MKKNLNVATHRDVLGRRRQGKKRFVRPQRWELHPESPSTIKKKDMIKSPQEKRGPRTNPLPDRNEGDNPETTRGGKRAGEGTA